MSPLPWLPEYELGHPIVDDQHRKWFQLTNVFLKKAYAGEADFASVEKTLESVVAYSCYHFQAEEAFMRSFGYPQSKLDPHIAAHDAFVKRMGELAQLCRQGSPETIQQMIDFLTGWLRKHIVETDVKYIRYYEEIGPEAFSPQRAQILRNAVRRRRARR
jgi:hemerythrin-like metal-binding protein